MTRVLSESGLDRQAVQERLDELRRADADMSHPDWHNRVFMYSFHVDEEVWQVAHDAYLKYARTDTLGPSVYPSLTKIQNDLVAIGLELLQGGSSASGSVTTGGTESIFLGMKTARDWAVENHPVSGTPEVVAPVTAHPAFNKSADYLGMKMVRVPEGRDFRADVPAMVEAINANTIGLIGSAPQYWHGVFDPIAKLGEIAEARNLWLHVDGCMGGFLAPFARNAGYPVPDFDLSVPGVKSISADLHKYAFTIKGVSVILLSDASNQKYQVFDWEDQYERYFTPTFSGTHCGAAFAAAWAVLQFLGESGYVKLAESIMLSQRQLVDFVKANEHLVLWGEPDLSIVSVGSPTLDIFAVARGLDQCGWLPNMFTGPDCIHFRFTPAHQPVMPKFLADIEAAVAAVKRGELKGEGRTRTYTG